MPSEKPTRLKLPSPDARSARSPFRGRDDPFGIGGAASVGIFTITINILNAETVTIDGKVYTWNTVLGVGDGDLFIGATAEDSLDALVAAINLDPTQVGILYGAATVVHPTVSAVDGAGLTVDVAAKFTGTAGDAITTVEGIVSAGAVWGGATLAGGADPDAAVAFVPIVQWGKIRIRMRITGADGVLGAEFTRPARDKEPNTDGLAFVYTIDQPDTNDLGWTDGAEISVEITELEHHGENWLKISLAAEASNAVIDFLDISGELLGLYH
jgi:hypothetical protein